jgi:hypothetical protein
VGTASQTELFLEARYFRSMEDDLSVNHVDLADLESKVRRP